MLWGQNKQTKKKIEERCNKFNKDFKNRVHQKILKKKSACFPTAWGSDIELLLFANQVKKYYLIFCICISIIMSEVEQLCKGLRTI